MRTGAGGAAGALGRRGPRTAARSAPPPSIVRREDPILLRSADGSTARRNAKVDTHGLDQETVDVLDSVLPPIEWRDQEGNMFMQYPSRAPATRMDTIETQEKLDDAFVERQARTRGVCSIREELYSQTFDEVLRQVTLRLPERGLMLLRVRDHLRMTLAGYRTLYKTSTEFGARKAKEGLVGIDEKQAEIDRLTAAIGKLRAHKLELERVCQIAERKTNDERAKLLTEQQKQREAVMFQNTQLKTFLSHAERDREPSRVPSAAAGAR